ncbi:D-aminoacylase [Candidatus Bathyarchaeota archaeon]|nr:D-aminoacylase [Candidatus Bathyarchaeota archaeon]
MSYDILIREGRVFDGSGGDWFYSDIGISDGRIVSMGRLGDARAERVIEAGGLAVSPGFIDTHSHTDVTIMLFPTSDSKVMQGVTTEVVGNCGLSLAPIKGDLELQRRYVAAFHPEMASLLPWSWRSLGEYYQAVERLGISVNLAPLIAAGNVRISVMGFENRTPTEGEMQEMREIVEEGMREGAFGLSTGLVYPPGVFTKTEEIIELAKVAARYGGIYSSHIRGEGDTLLQSVLEAIEIGRRAGIPVLISHIKVMGRANWGMSGKILYEIERARGEGIDVNADQYPYTAGSTVFSSILPPWAQEGGIHKLLERLRDPESRKRLREDLESEIPGWQNWVKTLGWESFKMISFNREENKKYLGKAIPEIASMMGRDPFEAAMDLILTENGGPMTVIFYGSEYDVEAYMKSPQVMVSTDAFGSSPTGPIDLGLQHPRTYGTYPRILGRYVRERGLLTLGEAIRKMTSLPARKIGLMDRGLLRPGMWADIVIFDPATVIDTATYEDPLRYPRGIRYVLVNGEVVVEEGKHTGKRPGKVLRKTPPSK